MAQRPVITSKNYAAGVCSASPLLAFGRFAGGDPFADGARPSPLAAADILHKFDSAPPRSSTAQKEAERRSAGSQLPGGCIRATTTHHFEMSSRRPELRREPALKPGCPQGVEGQSNHILHRRQSKLLRGPVGEAQAKLGAVRCCAQFCGTPQQPTAWGSPIERRERRWEARLSGVAAPAAQGPARRAMQHTAVGATARQIQQQGPARFSPP